MSISLQKKLEAIKSILEPHVLLPDSYMLYGDSLDKQINHLCDAREFSGVVISASKEYRPYYEYKIHKNFEFKKFVNGNKIIINKICWYNIKSKPTVFVDVEIHKRTLSIDVDLDCLNLN